MKKVKTIKVDMEKCSGCRLCEAICSASHAEPAYSIVNPSRARIRVVRDEAKDIYYPILAAAHATDVECPGRYSVVIEGKEYGDCSFCRVPCPSRDYFKEPGTEITLQCDLCEKQNPPEPKCVKWCLSNALTLSEREVPDEEGSGQE